MLSMNLSQRYPLVGEKVTARANFLPSQEISKSKPVCEVLRSPNVKNKRESRMAPAYLIVGS